MKPTDNYGKVRAEIARRILVSDLCRYLPDYYAAGLQRIGAGEEAPGSYSMLSLEFKRADTSANLYVESDSEWAEADRKDADGNEYVRYALKVRINHPSHGSGSPGTTLARLKLYQEVAMLAAELEAEFCGRQDVFRLVRTRVEREAMDAQRAAERTKAAVIAAINSVRTGMRVGSLRAVTSDKLLFKAPGGLNELVPEGDHEHRFDDGKRYAMRVWPVTEPGGVPLAMVTRTA